MEAVRRLDGSMRALWARMERRRWWLTATTAAAAGLSAGLLYAAAEHAAYLPPLAKTAAWAAVFAAVAGAWRFLARRLQPTPYAGAYPALSRLAGLPELAHALDLLHTGDPAREPLRDAALAQLAARLPQDRVDQALAEVARNHPWRRALWVTSGACINLLLLALLVPLAAPDTWSRITDPLGTYLPLNPFRHTISPADSVLEQGQVWPLRVQFPDARPNSVILALRTDEETGFRRYPLEALGDTFRIDTDPLFAPHTWYLEMDGYRTEARRLTVARLPRFRQLTLVAVPPPHTGLPTDSIPYPVPFIEVYAGTRLDLIAEADHPLVRAELRHAGGAVPLTGTPYRASHRLLAPDTLRFALADSLGLANRNPFAVPVRIRPDQLPTVAWVRPETDLVLPEARPVDLAYLLQDDFGFRSVRLIVQVRRGGGRAEPETAERLETPAGAADGGIHRWNPAGLALQPMDIATLWIEATDNDAVSGPKTVRSQPRLVRIASVAEQLLAETELDERTTETLESIEELARDNRQRLEELRQELADPGDRSDLQRNMEQMRRERERLIEQVEALQQEMDRTEQALRESPSVSEETRSRYEELQRLAQELDDPELRKAFEELMQAMQDMDPNRIRQALEQAEFDEERFRQRLDRTLELFKRLRTRASLERLATRLEQAAEDPTEEALDQAAQDMDRIPGEAPERMSPDLEELKQDLQREDQRARRNLDQNRKQDASENLKNMAREVRQALQGMNQQQAQLDVALLAGLLQNLLAVSDRQEELVRTVDALPQGSAAFVPAARTQNDIGRFFNGIADTLTVAAREIPALSNRVIDTKLQVLRLSASATGRLGERDRGRAGADARQALGGMNELATLIADLLEQASQGGGDGDGGGGGSMSQGLQQLSRDQQGLNQQLQDFINDQAGERLMEDGTQRLDRLARQQNALRRQLEEIRRNGGLEPGDPLARQLDQIARDMEDAINDLRGGATDRVTVRRQQNILTRMLEAEKAAQEREEEQEEREGRAADPFRRDSPPELTREELRRRLRDLLNDPEYTKYREEYRRLIERYLELP